MNTILILFKGKMFVRDCLFAMQRFREARRKLLKALQKADCTEGGHNEIDQSTVPPNMIS